MLNSQPKQEAARNNGFKGGSPGTYYGRLLISESDGIVPAQVVDGGLKAQQLGRQRISRGKMKGLRADYIVAHLKASKRLCFKASQFK